MFVLWSYQFVLDMQMSDFEYPDASHPFLFDKLCEIELLSSPLHFKVDFLLFFFLLTDEERNVGLFYLYFCILKMEEGKPFILKKSCVGNCPKSSQ